MTRIVFVGPRGIEPQSPEFRSGALTNSARAPCYARRAAASDATALLACKPVVYLELSCISLRVSCETQNGKIECALGRIP